MPAAEEGSDPFLPTALLQDQERLDRLFAAFRSHRFVLLAVSGGPDSTALMLLAQRWCRVSSYGPELHVASVDHGLRPEGREEAAAVGRLAAGLGLPHSVLTLDNAVPLQGIQEAARAARYRVLARHAHAVGASAIATAHTRDDQAETVLFRLMRGSGLSGLAGIPAEREMDGVALLRPLLSVGKQELIAVCHAEGVSFVEDPSNQDPRFARARLRLLLPRLEQEGLDAGRFARFAQRVARADAALEVAVDTAWTAIVVGSARAGLRVERAAWLALPEEIGLRLLGRLIREVGAEGQPELGKLEAFHGWLVATESGARTLAGALVRIRRGAVEIRTAPARRGRINAPDGNLHAAAQMVSATHLGKKRGRT